MLSCFSEVSHCFAQALAWQTHSSALTGRPAPLPRLPLSRNLCDIGAQALAGQAHSWTAAQRAAAAGASLPAAGAADADGAGADADADQACN